MPWHGMPAPQNTLGQPSHGIDTAAGPRGPAALAPMTSSFRCLSGSTGTETNLTGSEAASAALATW